MLKNLKKREEGFTIIEVMIVLAIAALILVVVLIAIPQLQRNQRNSARKAILTRVKTELDNYSSNNNGAYPTEDANATTGFNMGAGGFPTRYFQCGGGTYDCTINVDEPRSTRPMMFTSATTVPGFAVATYAGAGTDLVAFVHYNLGATCNGEAPDGAGSSRQYAIAVALEGGGSFCLDNN